MKTFRQALSQYLGWAVLGTVMAYAVGTVVYNDLTYEAPDVTTLRICHWQLEAGFRESLDGLIEAFERDWLARTGSKVRVVQVPISERAYQQYVNTGLIGDMAPDIIEKGKAKTVRDSTYVARFFFPLSPYLNQPNPYNVGTALEGVPWKDTFFDGMQGAYDAQLLDYYHIPFAMFTIRIYYNVDLLRAILGHGNPPRTYADFMAVCDAIAAHAREHELPLVPIAGSKSQGSFFTSKYRGPFLVDLAQACDLDFDGHANVFETYIGYQQGRWSFRHPALVQSAYCLMEIAKHFQDGWLAAERDDALFMFAQKRAVMLATGSWDAQSILDQTRGSFTVGVFDFPMPTDHPEYGKFVRGGASEAGTLGGIPWAINKKSKHPDLCIAFLQFCTTTRNNERFNTRITWLPVVRGVSVTNQTLQPFRPRLHGYSGSFQYNISTAVSLLDEGNRWTLYAGQLTPEENADQLQAMYDRTAAAGYRKEIENVQRRLRNTERIVAATMALRHIRADTAPAANAKLTQLDSASQRINHAYHVYRLWYEKAPPGREAHNP
jgi:raffinose/stachyose/melibiose transport system substrate-binding protein